MRTRAEVATGAAAFWLAVYAAAAPAQTAPPAAPQNVQAQIASQEAAIARAAAVFLDPAQPVQARVAAAEQVEIVVRPEQVAAAVRLARDPSQPAVLRGLALHRVVHVILADDALISDLLGWVASPATPVELQRAAVDVAETLMFSSLAGHARRGEFLEAFRALTRSPVPELRRRALDRLALEGDDFVQQRLLEELRSPDQASMPSAEAVDLLGLRLTADAYPVLRELLLRPPDPETRLAAIRLLGGDPQSRPDLIRIVQDGAEPSPARLAALGALHANVPEELPAIVLAVVQDEGASDELRVFAIQAVRWRRGSSRLRLKGIAEFDAAVRTLAATSKSEAVRRAARTYLGETESTEAQP